MVNMAIATKRDKALFPKSKIVIISMCTIFEVNKILYNK